MSIDFTDSLERVPVQIFDTPAAGAKWVARYAAMKALVRWHY